MLVVVAVDWREGKLLLSKEEKFVNFLPLYTHSCLVCLSIPAGGGGGKDKFY